MRLEGRHCGRLPALQRVGHTRQQEPTRRPSTFTLSYSWFRPPLANDWLRQCERSRDRPPRPCPWGDNSHSAKDPEAKIRGSQKGFQWVILGLERAQGVRKRVQRGPVGPPGPPELAALPCPRRIPRVLRSILLLLSPCTAAARRLLATRCQSVVHGFPIAPRVVVSGPCASTAVTTRCARAPRAPSQTEKPPKPLETPHMPRAATPREGTRGDLGDPSGRRKTPSGQPQ